MEEFAPGDLLSQAAMQMSENFMTEVSTTVTTRRGDSALQLASLGYIQYWVNLSGVSQFVVCFSCMLGLQYGVYGLRVELFFK